MSSNNVIVINCERRTKPGQQAAAQAVQPTAKKGPSQENQHLRPRVVRRWRLRQTIWQIADRENRRPSEIERILWEELAPLLSPALLRRVV